MYVNQLLLCYISIRIVAVTVLMRPSRILSLHKDGMVTMWQPAVFRTDRCSPIFANYYAMIIKYYVVLQRCTTKKGAKLILSGYNLCYHVGLIIISCLDFYLNILTAMQFICRDIQYIQFFCCSGFPFLLPSFCYVSEGALHPSFDWIPRSRQGCCWDCSSICSNLARHCSSSNVGRSAIVLPPVLLFN